MPESRVDELAGQLGVEWPAILKARATTNTNRLKLQNAFHGKVSSDSSLVLFGSVARQEMTSASDADWILLVDGHSQPEHEDEKHDMAKELERLGFAKPGKSGIFGCLVGSHSLIHEIGGEDDTNSNTTRRVLLLLESFPVGDTQAYDRVRRQILNRYLKDDRGLLRGRGPTRVPRFLLNDLTRYWRTVTVDFVYKQRADAGKKWALRNAKLRMSRKLIFATGLLRCFFCHLDPAAMEAQSALRQTEPDMSKLLTYMEAELSRTPLELLATAAQRPLVPRTTAAKIFASYDRFLAVLDDETRRKELDDLQAHEMAASSIWKEVQEISRGFQDGLTELFFGDDGELRALSTRYGLF